MKPAPPSPRVRPHGKSLCALGALKLVLDTGAEQHTFTRTISVLK
jgi:hypothetical protein